MMLSLINPDHGCSPHLSAHPWTQAPYTRGLDPGQTPTHSSTVPPGQMDIAGDREEYVLNASEASPDGASVSSLSSSSVEFVVSSVVSESESSSSADASVVVSSSRSSAPPLYPIKVVV